jgi:hypothetical protein
MRLLSLHVEKLPGKEERNVNEISIWIEHLRHPLVLVGFGLFVFALIIKPLFLNNQKLSGTAVERLLHKAMILLFILAAMAVAGGIALGWRNGGAADKEAAAIANVEQATQGAQSPAINSGKDARINYGGAAAAPKKAAKENTAGTEKQKVAPVQVKQETRGAQSPAVNAKGDVEINYGK